MHSAYAWGSLAGVAVLIVLVGILVVVLRSRSRARRPSSLPAAAGAAPSVASGPGEPATAAPGTGPRQATSAPEPLLGGLPGGNGHRPGAGAMAVGLPDTAPSAGPGGVAGPNGPAHVGGAPPGAGGALPGPNGAVPGPAAVPVGPNATAPGPDGVPARRWSPAEVRELAMARQHAIESELHGTVRGGDGTPLANAVLTVINVTGGQVGSARSGPDGGFRLDIPEPGAYILIARGVNHEPHATTVVVQGRHTAIDVELASAAGLTGVISDATGDPVPDATVILTNANGAVATAQRTNVQGGYSITDLAVGLYTVTVTAAGFAPVAQLVDVPATGVARGDIALSDRNLTLRGTAVHADDGRGLTDVRVRLLDDSGRVQATQHTAPGGGYEFTGLRPGRYTVVASGYAEVTSTVRLSEGTVGDHEVRMAHRDEAPAAARTGWADAGADDKVSQAGGGEERGQ